MLPPSQSDAWSTSTRNIDEGPQTLHDEILPQKISKTQQKWEFPESTDSNTIRIQAYLPLPSPPAFLLCKTFWKQNFFSFLFFNTGYTPLYTMTSPFTMAQVTVSFSELSDRQALPLLTCTRLVITVTMVLLWLLRRRTTFQTRKKPVGNQVLPEWNFQMCYGGLQSLLIIKAFPTLVQRISLKTQFPSSLRLRTPACTYNAPSVSSFHDVW